LWRYYISASDSYGVTGGSGKELAMSGHRTPAAVLQAIREGVELGWTYQDIRLATGTSTGVIAEVKRTMGRLRPVRVPAPTSQYASPGPTEYFQAIHDGILAGYAREQALSDRVALLQTRITELESQNSDLTDSITQTRARMSNWVGPTPLPHRNLSTGG